MVMGSLAMMKLRIYANCPCPNFRVKNMKNSEMNLVDSLQVTSSKYWVTSL